MKPKKTFIIAAGVMLIAGAACDFASDENNNNGGTNNGGTNNGGTNNGGTNNGGTNNGGTNNGGTNNGGTNNGGTNNGGTNNSGTNNGSTNSNTNSNTNNINPGTWQTSGIPCEVISGLYFDDGVGYLGCGDDAFGPGLFLSEDAGVTWGDSERDFEEVRVYDTRRGPDGVLYGAGRSQIDDFAVWEFDESNPDRPQPIPLYLPSNNAGTNVNDAQHIAITQDGQLLADSVTGKSITHRPAGETEWVEYGYFNEEILDDPMATEAINLEALHAYNDRFYGVGGSFANGPFVAFPSDHADATIHMARVYPQQPITHVGTFTAMHIWGDNDMIVAGFDDDTDETLVYLCEADCRDAGNWTRSDFYDSGLEWEGAINDISVQGDTIVTVGEKIPTAEGGFVVVSFDKGQSWVELTSELDPVELPVMQRAWLREDGTATLLGSGASYVGVISE